MTITQLAGSLPRSARFREWLASIDGGEPLDEEMAADFIRLMCMVTSRRDIAGNADAERRFHNLIRKPYLAWCEQMEQVA